MKYFYLLLFFAFSIQVSSQNILFDKSHKSTILIPDNPSEYEIKAAKLLQESVFKISGIKPDISNKDGNIILTSDSIFVKSKIPNFNFSHIINGGFLIQANNNGVLIYGDGQKGVYYGVVDLLERFWHCRKLSPWAEIFPKSSSLKLPDTLYFDNPKNDIRIVYGDFMMNHPDFNDWCRLDNIQTLFAKDYYVHTFHKLLPKETYFDTHPEYFSELNGTRNNNQLCPSHPEVLKIVIDKLRAEMALQPNANLWSVSQNDNTTYCHCERCAKIIAEEGSPIGPILRLVNSVADTFPDKTISTLAYQYSRHAPIITKPRPNVQIMLCTIELNRSQAIAEDPRSADFVKDLKDWGHICKNIYLWDYGVDFMHFLMPFPNLHVLKPNIQLFTNNGCSAQFQQVNTARGHEMSELKNYLLSKILWNPDVDVQKAKKDFLNDYYGAAAPYILAYLDKLESEIIKTHEFLDIYGHPTAYKKTFLSENNINEYDSLFSKALKAAKGEYLDRVKIARLSVLYAKLQIAKSEVFSSRGFFMKALNEYVPNIQRKHELELFYSDCKKYGIKSLSENNATVEDFYQTTLRNLTLNTRDNYAFQKKVTINPPASQKYSNGDAQTLTDGVMGSGDFKSNWIGWQGESPTIIVDLEKTVKAKSIMLSSLYMPNSWILHPKKVTCEVSEDGQKYVSVGTLEIEGDQKNAESIHQFKFSLKNEPIRYIKIYVEIVPKLFDWHNAAGQQGWVFLDEILVE